MSNKTSRRPGRGWAYVCAQLGGAASIAANIAHSYVPPAGAPAEWSPQPGAVISAVFWPVAVLAAIEAFARVPWPDGARWVLLRFGGLLPVALVAAVVSYLHLSGLLASYGAESFETRVGPLAVDGLMVIGTGALIATSRTRRRDLVDAVEAWVDAPDAPTSPAPAGAVDFDPWSLAEPAHEREAAPEPVMTPGRTRTRALPAAERVARLRKRHPDVTQSDAARRLKLSVRTVARHWQPAAESDQPIDQPTPEEGQQ
jgi:hypothetical protein